MSATKDVCATDATPLTVCNLRKPSQIQSKKTSVPKRRVRSGLEQRQPRQSGQSDSVNSLGICACDKSFVDYCGVKQVRACYEVEQKASASSCAKCPVADCATADEAFPLPSPSPCCQPAQNCCDCACQQRPLPPPVIHRCPPPKGKVLKLSLIDPCDKSLCKWSISQDDCGSGALLFKALDCDKALLDCDGNLNLLGKLEATGFCFAPDVDTPDQQWRIVSNAETDVLQIDCIDRTDPPPNNFYSAQSVYLNKTGVLVQGSAKVDYTAAFDCFEIASADVPATVMVHNTSLLPGKTLKVGAGLYEAQHLTIVNVDNVSVDANMDGNVKEIAGESLLQAVWSSTASKWICK